MGSEMCIRDRSVVGRNTQGVRIIRLKDSENLVRLARIAEPDEEEAFVEEGDVVEADATVEAATLDEAAAPDAEASDKDTSEE